jgi:hypothetical protein
MYAIKKLIGQETIAYYISLLSFHYSIHLKIRSIHSFHWFHYIHYIFSFIYLLKVMSCQIESAWAWYHWIGPKKDINRYSYFLISVLNTWKDFKVLSRFMQKWIQPPVVPITVYIELLLPIGWRTFIWWKIPPKFCTILFGIAGCWNSSNILLTDHNPKNNCWFFAVLEHGSAEKIAVCAHTTHVPNVFFVWSGLFFSNIQN